MIWLAAAIGYIFIVPLLSDGTVADVVEGALLLTCMASAPYRSRLLGSIYSRPAIGMLAAALGLLVGSVSLALLDQERVLPRCLVIAGFVAVAGLWLSSHRDREQPAGT